MFKGIAFFALVWLLTMASVSTIRKMSNKTRWSHLKTTAFGAATAMVATVIVVTIVVLF